MNWSFSQGGYRGPTHNSRNMPVDIPRRLFTGVLETAKTLSSHSVRRCSFQEALTTVLRDDGEDEL